MPYVPSEKTKTAIMRYIERTIRSKKFNFKQLTFDSISKHIHISEENIKEALDELESDLEITKIKSNLEIYVPYEFEKEKNLKSYHLGNPLRKVSLIYLIGLASFVLMFYLLPSFKTQILLQLDFSKPDNFIPNSVILGLAFPLAFGGILNIIYDDIRKRISNINIEKGIIFFIASIALALILYIFLTIILKTSLTPEGILAALALGIAVPSIGTVLQHFKGKIKR
jgi:hypothetical protein